MFSAHKWSYGVVIMGAPLTHEVMSMNPGYVAYKCENCCQSCGYHSS